MLVPQSFLRDCTFLQVLETDRVFLSSPTTVEDLTEALEGAKKHKSLGSDGLPAEVYSCYDDILLLPLLQALSEAPERGCLPDNMQEAIIVMIPKPGKDKLLPDSYCPISLLNLDVKLLAPALANRLSKVIGGHVHQSGCIPTRSTANKILDTFFQTYKCKWVILGVGPYSP